MPVKPLVVHFTDSSEFAGAEQTILTTLAALDSSRWKLLLVHHPHQALDRLVDGASDLGVETVAVPRLDPGWQGIERVPGFAGRLRSLRPAIIHFHLTWPLACQYAIVAGRFAGPSALVATAHLYVETPLSARARLQQRILSRLVDRYLAVSGAVKEELVTKLGWPEKRIEVVHNGVALPADLPQPDKALRRDMTGGSEGGAVVLVPARLNAQKGQSVLLRAAPAVAGANFVFAGDGPDRAALAALASQLGVDERVTFLGRRRDVQKLIATADVVVLPSWYEGLPLAVLEAMAAGRPVVASRIPGIREIITEGADGVLFEPGDPADLARAIGEVLGDPNEARRLGATARQTVAGRFSAGTMGDRIGQVYAALLGC